MIDLEDALSALVERAPEPPEVGRIVRRAQQRRWRRRSAALTMSLIVLSVAFGVVVAVTSARHARHVSVVAPPTESVRVTLLDGSQLEISGPASLGLTKLLPAFNGALSPDAAPQYGVAHGFSVGHSAPAGLGAVVARYPTHDGHELVVHGASNGVEAVVDYGDWWLSSYWSTDSTDWAQFAAALNAKETADGFLVIEPVDPAWKLSFPDAPDVQLGGEANGSGAAFAFFGPSYYPAGCPTAAQTDERTSQGWGVELQNGAWWCDSDAKVRVAVWQHDLIDTALKGLQVSYTDAQHAVDRVTTLDGDTFDITAPSSVLDQLTAQSAVYVEGLDEPNLLNETPNLLPVSATRSSLPSTGAATSPSYATGDGHRLFSYVPPTDCGCEMLAGEYGKWLVEIEVQGMSTTQRTQIASLLTAHETSDGFLVLDPVAPMHLGPGPGSDIVLDNVDLITSQTGACSPQEPVEARTPEGFGVHLAGAAAIWCDTNARVTVTTDKTLVDKIRVRRVG